MSRCPALLGVFSTARVLLVGWGVLVLILGAPRSVSAAPSSLAWVAPVELRTFTWGAAQPGASLAKVEHPERTVPLRGQELLLVPVANGDIVRLSGAGFQMGEGMGFGDTPDVITWHAVGSDVTEVEHRVRTWGTGQFVVVRALSHSARVRVRIAQPRKDSMAWYRADGEVYRWLGGHGDAPRFEAPLGDAEPIVAWLSVAQELLDERSAGQSYLQARWLSEAAPVRPVSSPFFESVRLELRGGTAHPTRASQSDPKRPTPHRLRVGDTLTLRARDADRFSVLVRARAVGTTVVRLRSGDAVVEELRVTVPLRAHQPNRWTPVRRLSAVPVRGQLRVEVTQGSALVWGYGYVQQGAILQSRIRSRERLLARARRRTTSSRNDLLASLVEVEEQRSLAAAAQLLRRATEPSVSNELRAFALHEVVRLSADAEFRDDALREFWKATETLLPAQSIVLRRSALEHLARATSRPLDVALPSNLPVAHSRSFDPVRLLGSASPTLAEEQGALHAFLAMLFPPRDRARSPIAPVAEAFAAHRAGQSQPTRRASQLWRRTAPWRNLTPEEPTTTLTRFTAALPERPLERDCALHGTWGTRWLKLGRTDTVRVADRGGTHTRVRLRGVPGEPSGDTEVAIDGTSLSVHAAAGLRTTVAVTPGSHHFEQLSSNPVIAQFPSPDRFPCARLLDGVRWTVLRGTARFVLPSGNAETVGSIVVSREWLPHPTRLRVIFGATSYEAWVRPPASGLVEFPVPAGERELSVTSNHPLLIRVRVRAHRSPSAGPPSQSPSATVGHELGEQELVARVRTATQKLRRAMTSAEREAQRRARAKALEHLGYTRLADVDRARLSVPPPPAPPRPRASYAMKLPRGSGAVVPMGEFPMIPPLPRPPDDGFLARLVANREAGEDPLVLLADLEPRARDSSSADALLLGLIAEQVGRLEVASGAYERIGRAHRSGVALGRAARLAADAAGDSADPERALRAYRLARDAKAYDGSGTGTLARMTTAISWDRLQPDTAAGSVLVESSHSTDPNAPLGVRVRRALIDAPSFALVTQGEPVRTSVRRVEGGLVQVDALCHHLGAREPCAVTVRLDGAPVCEAATKTAPAGTVARPITCRVPLPGGAQQVVVEPPRENALAWVAVREVTSAGLRVVPTRGRWFEADHERGVVIRVLGPAMIRVRARSDGSPAQVATLTHEAPVEGLHREQLPLDARIDEAAKRLPARDPLTREIMRYLTLNEPGVHVISLAPSKGRLLVRLEVARVVDAPRPRAINTETVPPSQAAREVAQRAPLVRPEIGRDPRVGRFTLSASLGYIVEDLTEADRDPADDFFQVSVHARHRVPVHPLWLRVSSFARLRAGAPSQGFESRASAITASNLPGGFAFARLVTQDGPKGRAQGWLAAAGIHHRVPIGSLWTIAPTATLTARRVDSSMRDQPDADGNVYSPYSANRPRTLDLGVRAGYRAFVDTGTWYGLHARLGPDLDWVDRVDVSARATALPGRGYVPRIQLETVLSHRPEVPVRAEAFTRWSVSPSFVFWHWASDSSRFTLSGRLVYFVDFPLDGARSSEVSGALLGGYDFVARRGVTDFAPGDRFFADRQVEDHAPPERKSPKRYPYWEEDQ